MCSGLWWLQGTIWSARDQTQVGGFTSQTHYLLLSQAPAYTFWRKEPTTPTVTPDTTQYLPQSLHPGAPRLLHYHICRGACCDRQVTKELGVLRNGFTEQNGFTITSSFSINKALHFQLVSLNCPPLCTADNSALSRILQPSPQSLPAQLHSLSSSIFQRLLHRVYPVSVLAFTSSSEPYLLSHSELQSYQVIHG